VLYLLLLLLLTWLVLAGLLWGGTHLVQGGLYENPTPELFWRGPAAAGGITAFLAAWCLLNYAGSTPEEHAPYAGLFNFASDQTSDPVKEFWAVRPDLERKHFHLKILEGTPLRFEYRDESNGKWQTTIARETEALVIKEGGEDVLFKPDRQKSRWEEEGGKHRYMTPFDSPGRMTTTHPGRSVFSLVLNVLHLGVWFVCLWLLLRFQWPHALLGAAVFWFIMTFLVATYFAWIPPKQAPPAATALVHTCF